MIIAIYGPDTYRSKQYLDKIIAKFKAERDPAGYNVVVLDAEVGSDGPRLVSELFATPFLAEKRMVVIKNLLSSKLTDVREQMSVLLKDGRIPESTVAVFWERNDEFKNKDSKALLNILQKEKYHECFPLLVSAEASGWFRSLFDSQGVTLERGVSEASVRLVGTDSFVLKQLADQLICYHHGKAGNVTMQDLNEFTEEKADNNVFNLVDSIISGKVKATFGMMREQYRIGEDEHYILGMLIRQFRIMIQIADTLQRSPNLQPDGMAKELDLHPFVVKKTIGLIKKFKLDDLKKRFCELSEFDLKIKTGQGDIGVLLDTFVIEMQG